jgi:transposase InsO family protein
MSFIDKNRDKWHAKALCQVMGVSEGGYYKHARQQVPPERHSNLLARIYEILREDVENANYGARRIYLALKLKKGYRVSLSTIYRICRENGLIIRKKRKPNGITKEDSASEKSENLIHQDFRADAPNEKWLSDITEVPCIGGKLYLSAILDCYDGKIVGFNMGGDMKAELCIKAFENACMKEGARGMVFHSDRGSQFTSQAFRDALDLNGAIHSMSGTVRCFDNARMEGFFATLKKEKLYRMNTEEVGMSELKSIIFRYICYYNLRRIYSTNGGHPPESQRQMYFRLRNAA